MKEQTEIPDGLYYTKEHEWAKLAGSVAVIGITDYAAKTLNDIVYLSLPESGKELKQLTTFGTVESTKAVSELYAPVSGKVTKVNTELVNHPELVNHSPYDKGWIIEITTSDLDNEKTKLLNSKQYAEFLTTLDS
jgi:glycine cleavage system H protein